MTVQGRWVTDPDNENHEHLDGIKHFEAPLPRRFHHCKPQSRGWVGWMHVQRCACGAIRLDKNWWTEKNSRRKPYSKLFIDLIS